MTHDLVGKTIGGQYRILSRIGAGGLGEVYLGRALTTDSEVVVKAIRVVSDAARTLLLREARILSTLDSPFVVRHLGFVVEGAETYLVQERVRGVPLADWQRPAVELARILDVYAQIATGLHHVHARGVVHRDLKPTNVLVHEDRAKIIDFGLAVVDREPDTLTSTRATVVGTPRYMSPEMIRGADVSSACDIFSLGVMLYEAVTGDLPYESSTIGAMLRSRLGQADVSRVRDGALRALLARMLAGGSDHRPSALEVANALTAMQQAGSSIADSDVNMTVVPPAPAAETGVRSSVRATAARWHPRVVFTIVGLAAVAMLLTLDPQSMSIGWGQGWGVGLVLGMVLVGWGLLLRQSERATRLSMRAGPGRIERRLRAIEVRLKDMDQVSASVAIDVERLKPAFIDMARDSLLVALREAKVGASAETVHSAVQALADMARENERAPLHKRLSTWLTIGGLTVGLTGGCFALLAQTGAWKPNTQPKIKWICAEHDRLRASRTRPLEIRVLAEDDDGDALMYRFVVSCGRIHDQNGPMAIWRPEGTDNAEFVEIEVTVSDGTAAVRASRTVRINRRPPLTIALPSSSAPGSTLTLSVEGPADEDGDDLSFSWVASDGSLRSDKGRQVFLVAPRVPCTVRVQCSVHDGWETWDLPSVELAVQ